MKEFYVYLLVDPITELPFYVGKGKNNRMHDHEYSVKNKKDSINPKLLHKINKILSLGLKIIYKKQLENVTEQEALDLEEYLIGYYGLKNLCNISHGGIGGDTFTNNQNKEQIRKKLSELNKGSNNCMYGKTHTEESKEKIRIARKNAIGKYKRPEELKIKQSKYKKEWWTDDRKNEQSKAKQGAGNSMYGTTHYDVWLKKYGEEEAKRRWIQKTERAAQWHKGRKRPKETGEKITAAKKRISYQEAYEGFLKNEFDKDEIFNIVNGKII
jgi:hypothetical protein